MVPLAELLTDPSRAQELAPEAMPALLAQCAALQAVLAARLVEVGAVEKPTVGENTSGGGDRWLTPEEADDISHLGIRWLYRHWPQVPGAKKFSARRLRFHERQFRRWLEKRS